MISHEISHTNLVGQIVNGIIEIMLHYQITTVTPHELHFSQNPNMLIWLSRVLFHKQRSVTQDKCTVNHINHEHREN